MKDRDDLRSWLYMKMAYVTSIGLSVQTRLDEHSTDWLDQLLTSYFKLGNTQGGHKVGEKNS